MRLSPFGSSPLHSRRHRRTDDERGEYLSVFDARAQSVLVHRTSQISSFFDELNGTLDERIRIRDRARQAAGFQVTERAAAQQCRFYPIVISFGIRSKKPERVL